MGGMFGFTDDGQIIDFVEGRLAFLKAELKITDAQTRQWNTFAEAVRSNAKTVNTRRMHLFAQDWSQQSLPERLDQEEAVLRARLDAFHSISAAVRPLYAVLDGTQQKTADTLLFSPMGGVHGGFM